MGNLWGKTGTDETSISVSFIGYRSYRDRKIPKNRYQRQKQPALPSLLRALEMQLVLSFQQNLPSAVRDVRRSSDGFTSFGVDARRFHLHADVALWKWN